ncbi:Hypothetical predicted protein [Octopus vulgaris]|uniref:Secreted protein n=1 Tax=Octopus vulgaris TaxID=6645 RepID=A0AA36F4N7_OCTVU|nr:Hypothetical predicted protein [Octopus vulgaris]
MHFFQLLIVNFQCIALVRVQKAALFSNADHQRPEPQRQQDRINSKLHRHIIRYRNGRRGNYSPGYDNSWYRNISWWNITRAHWSCCWWCSWGTCRFCNV